MKVDIYRSVAQPELFMTVPAGHRILKAAVPSAYEQVYPHLLGEEIRPGEPRAGVDSAAMIAEIHRCGIALHTARVSVHRQTLP